MTCTSDIDTDAQLMIRVQDGDSDSFSLLFNRNRTFVVHCLSRMVRNDAVAQELAQSVFIRVYRARAAYEPTAKFSTWLYRIATNVGLNYFRDEKKTRRNFSLDVPQSVRFLREAADRALPVEERLVRETVAAEIREAIRALPPKQRAAMVMHKYQDMDYGEIARVLGCTPSAVKAMMFRAYETLRFRLRHLNLRGAAAKSAQVVHLAAPGGKEAPAKKPESIAA